MRSVTQVNVDETEEFFARPETPDVFRDSLCEQRENHFLGVGRVRVMRQFLSFQSGDLRVTAQAQSRREPRTDDTLAQRLDQCGGVHESSSTHVDQPRVVSHDVQLTLTNHVIRLRGQRGSQPPRTRALASASSNVHCRPLVWRPREVLVGDERQ